MDIDNDRFNIKGKIAMVTGAGRGIGYAIALGLARYGADIAIISRNLGELKKVAEEIRLMGRKALPFTCDISKIKDMPQRILAGMKDLRLFEEKINSEITILAGDKDELVPKDWILNFAKAQNVDVKFYNDDHTFTKNMQLLPDIIANIIKKDIKR